jgi:peroxiredoxin
MPSETMSEQNQMEVQVGRPAPNFKAHDLDGNELWLRSLIGGKRALLLFYRGGWCPFCNEQLATLSRDREKFEQSRAIIVAVSGEDVEKGRELLKKLNLPFKLLSDTKFEGIDTYGVRDTNISEKTKARGITQLAKPSAFIIDEHGVIRYKYVGTNAPDRPKNEELLRVLNEMGV